MPALHEEALCVIVKVCLYIGLCPSILSVSKKDQQYKDRTLRTVKDNVYRLRRLVSHKNLPVAIWLIH